jgi:hypothetical protein
MVLGRRELGAAFPAEFQGIRIVGMAGRALVGHVGFPFFYGGLKITSIGEEVNRGGWENRERARGDSNTRPAAEKALRAI